MSILLVMLFVLSIVYFVYRPSLKRHLAMDLRWWIRQTTSLTIQLLYILNLPLAQLLELSIQHSKQLLLTMTMNSSMSPSQSCALKSTMECFATVIARSRTAINMATIRVITLVIRCAKRDTLTQAPTVQKVRNIVAFCTTLLNYMRMSLNFQIGVTSATYVPLQWIWVLYPTVCYPSLIELPSNKIWMHACLYVSLLLTA